MFERHPRSTRRRFLMGGAALAGATLLSGCDALVQAPWFRRVLDKDEDANKFVQRLLLSDQKLAPEFSEADLSPHFKPNGTDDPKDTTYKALAKDGFKDYRLEIGGLVQTPQSLTLADLRAVAARTQITRHDCVEGWSCIGKWTGVPLGALLTQAGLKPEARFIVFSCFDSMDEGGGGLESLGDASADGNADTGGNEAQAGDTVPVKAKPADSKTARSTSSTTSRPDVGSRYYESIDLADAFHPQTILAYEMNGQPLPIPHGAPLRLRVERQLGYKMAKYIMRIDVVASLDGIGKGGGGYWEDQGYEWYAGI